MGQVVFGDASHGFYFGVPSKGDTIYTSVLRINGGGQNLSGYRHDKNVEWHAHNSEHDHECVIAFENFGTSSTGGTAIRPWLTDAMMLESPHWTAAYLDSDGEWRMEAKLQWLRNNGAVFEIRDDARKRM
ncbi:hypothetical protein BGW39_010160 [Mortierella sp. 14UC]|nr:hypothetical protein BGW39_010160 [Mortierella sp. 14UC]